MDDEGEEEEEEADFEESDDAEVPLNAKKWNSVSVKLKVTEEEDCSNSSPEIIGVHIPSDSDDISYEQYLNSNTNGANKIIDN